MMYPQCHTPIYVLPQCSPCYTQMRMEAEIKSIAFALFDLSIPQAWIEQLGLPKKQRKYCCGKKQIQHFEAVWDSLTQDRMKMFLEFFGAKLPLLHHQHQERLAPVILALDRLGVPLSYIRVNCGGYVGNLLHFICTKRWGLNNQCLDKACIQVLVKHIDVNQRAQSGFSCLDILFGKISFQCFETCPNMLHKYTQEFKEDLHLATELIQAGHAVSENIQMKLMYMHNMSHVKMS